jgi:hypothetical protein
MRGLLLVVLVGCVRNVVPEGGTPGVVVFGCAETDRVCKSVRGALEMRRHNIGMRCGTSTVTAGMVLREEGYDALPYLERAFDDPDPEVAVMAMTAVLALGARDSVVDWCSDVSDRFRIEMCRTALAYE